MAYHLLLVDDDTEFLSEFAQFLEEYEVSTALNGYEALEILSKPHEIDLVVLDVKMPGLSGTEVLKRVKSMDPNLPVIILTGHSSKDVVIDSLKGGANDYLEKPVDPEKAKLIIEKFLAKPFVTLGTGDGMKSKIEKVKRFAERNFHKKISLKHAAKSVYLCPKYLSRLFKQTTGMGFGQFRVSIAIKKSKELLENTDFTIEQIAFQVGYQNSESFIRIFKKITGLTPTEYRKQFQR